MEHVSLPLARVRLKLQRRALAPLEPDLFLAWWWARLPPAQRLFGPLTVEDICFELQRVDPTRTVEETRLDYLHIAARVRRNQRLGLEPFEGI